MIIVACPVCGGNTGYSVNSMETFLCGTCGALFNASPFGMEVITTDARERFPKYAEVYDVEAWREHDDATEDSHPQPEGCDGLSHLEPEPARCGYAGLHDGCREIWGRIRHFAQRLLQLEK